MFPLAFLRVCIISVLGKLALHGSFNTMLTLLSQLSHLFICFYISLQDIYKFTKYKFQHYGKSLSCFYFIGFVCLGVQKNCVCTTIAGQNFMDFLSPKRSYMDHCILSTLFVGEKMAQGHYSIICQGVNTGPSQC